MKDTKETKGHHVKVEEEPKAETPKAGSPWQAVVKRETFEARPYQAGENGDRLKISDVDRGNGSPKGGDMVVRKAEGAEEVLVSAARFAADFSWNV